MTGARRRRPDAARPRSPRGSRRASSPVLVAGPDIDASGAWDAAVALAERQSLPVCAIPATGRRPPRLPRGPPALPRPAAAGDRPRRRDARGLRPRPGRRLLGLPVLPEHPGPAPPRGNARSSQITSDPDEAARAPMGDALVGDVRLALEALLDARRRVRPRRRPVARPDPAAGPRSSDPLTGTAAMHAPRDRRSPTTGSSCSSRRPRRSRCATSCGSPSPARYYFGAGGGLGFGLAAAVGVQLAQPDRPVVCVVGEGSAQYAITALLDARPPTTCRSPSWSCATASTRSSSGSPASRTSTGAPGLDLPALDAAGGRGGLRRRRRAR